jgi:hypothetical protein
VADPFDITGMGEPGPGGADSDLTAAPVANAGGQYNVYATSLWVGSSSLAWSSDGGATWTVDPLGGVPAEDRPWVAASGACDVYLAYHQLPSWSPFVNHYNVCTLPQGAGMGVALNPLSNSQVFLANSAPGLSNAFGKIWADNSPSSPHSGTLYIPMEGCDLETPSDFLNGVVYTAEQVPGCPGDTQILIATSADQGQTWNDYVVAKGSVPEIPVWPDTVATDGAGALYLAWGDDHNVYLNTSSDGGQTWTASRQLNPTGTTAVYPTVSAAGGVIDIAWYETGVKGDSNDSKAMGKAKDPTAAPWHLVITKSTDGAASFARTVMPDVIHYGALCTQGSTCPSDGSRNLLDDFGVAVNPATGRAAIAYTSDNYPGDPGVSYTAFAAETGPTAKTCNTSGGSSPGGALLGTTTGVFATVCATLSLPSGGVRGAAHGLPNTSGDTPAWAALLLLLSLPLVAAGRHQLTRRRLPSR